MEKFKKIVARHGVLIALIVLIVVNIIWQGQVFLDPVNLRNILSQNAYVGMIAVGMTLVIIGGGIDLSVGSMMGLVGVFTMLTLNKVGTDPNATFAAAFVALGFGTFAGLVNGLIISAGRVPPFVATLAGLVAFRSVGLALTQASEQTAKPGLETFGKIAGDGITIPGLTVGSRGLPFVVQWPIFLFFILAGVAAWMLNKSVYGRRLIATGANEQAAIYSGINTARVKVASYAFLGFCAGLAGLCQASRLSSVSPSSLGMNYELDAIAAVVIGGTSLSGGKGQIGTTILGVLLLGIISNMLITASVDPNWQGCVKGVIILLAVLLQRANRQNA